MNDFSTLTAIGLFILYVAVDVMYAYYTLTVTALKPARAATIGAVMYVMLAAGVISYSQNAWYLVPIRAGSWVGTFLAVSIEKRRKG